VTNAPSFADLVEAVKPAVVSIIVEGGGKDTHNLQKGGKQFEFNFPDLPDDHPFKDFMDQFGQQFVSAATAPSRRASSWRRARASSSRPTVTSSPTTMSSRMPTR